MVFKIKNNMYPIYLDKFVKLKNVDINLRIKNPSNKNDK